MQVCQKNRFGVKGRRPFHRTWIFFPPTTSAGQAPTGGSSWRGCLQGLTGQHGLRTKEGFLTFGIGCPRQALSLDRVAPFPHTGFLFPPGPRSARLRSRHDSQGDAPRQARASLAYSTASPGARARRSRITPPCQARGPPRSRALPRRACCCVFYRLARHVGVDVNARPTASRACCCVFYRLARRAGVDVRAPYCAARLLSRILPPRQARGRRRSRVLPRRALAVAYSTASPGVRGSPPLSRRQEHTRSRAQSRPLRLQMRTRRFQRNPPPS